jgi:hypothetical protein
VVSFLMILRLKDKSFPVKLATLSAVIPDPYWSQKYDPDGYAGLSWSLCIETERDSTNEIWGARAYHETLRYSVRRWIEVAGQVVDWSEPFDAESGEPNGGFYVFEHADISRGRLAFLERSGARMRFNWEGLCDVFFNEEYGKDLPFCTFGWATFQGVTVNGNESDTDATLRARLAENLDPDDFIQGAFRCEGTRYVSGVKMARAIFTPAIL